MANLINWINETANGEEIEAIIFGESDLTFFEEDYTLHPLRNKVISFEEAKPILDYEFNAGYGSSGCHPITAWTKSWVIFISTYDGSTCPCRLPRNPTAFAPYMPGGG